MEKWKNAKNIAKNEKKLKNVKKCKKMQQQMRTHRGEENIAKYSKSW